MNLFCSETHENAVVYVHGKGGNAGEAAHYVPLFPDCDVIGFDYRAAAPWEAEEEFPAFFDPLFARYARVSLIANSIGAYFSLCSLASRPLSRAWFISPVTDMESLILGMMASDNVTEDALRLAGTLPSSSGEPLSWHYLAYSRRPRPAWRIPTHVLCADRDPLVPLSSLSAFPSVLVMPGGEHWFHTAEEMRFLDRWIEETRGQLG